MTNTTQHLDVEQDDWPVADFPRLAFAEPPQGAAWTQLDIALVRAGGDARASARRLFARCLPWWLAERRAGRAFGMFFMRKPPDVRLRVALTPAARPAFAELCSTLADAVRVGEIAGCQTGCYAPETVRFGGERALAATHALFTLDTLLWARLDTLAVAGLRSIDRADLLLAVFDDLFARLGGHEQAHAWRCLAAEIPPEMMPVGALPLRPRLLGDLATDHHLHAAERAIAAAYAAGHALYVAALCAAPPEGRTRAEVAAAAAFFAFNRHGFPGTRSAPLVLGVLAGATRESGGA